MLEGWAGEGDKKLSFECVKCKMLIGQLSGDARRAVGIESAAVGTGRGVRWACLPS